MTDTTQTNDRMRVHDGEDFVCPSCRCEIMVKHAGDPSRMPNMQPAFTCCCGTRMVPEHASDRS